MRGYFIKGVALAGVCCFSGCVFLSDGLALFWLFLELSTLSLVPCFFLSLSDTSLQSLFSYLIASGISSFFILCGVMWESMLLLLIIGLLIKFGLFPFMGWVYSVFCGANWVVVWGISVVLKSSFLMLPFFLSSGGVFYLDLLCSLSFLVLTVLFWVFSFEWLNCWCHMMLSSSVSLVAMSVVLSGDSLIWIYLVYFLWSTSVIYFLSFQPANGCGVMFYYFFVGLLVSYPLSLSIFYKLFMGVSMFSCGALVFFSWVIYSVSEQFYLLKFVIGSSSPRGAYSFINLV